MVTLITGLPETVVGLEATGEVTDEDYESTVIPAVDAVRERFGKVRLLYVLGEGFEGYTAGALWDDAKLGIEHPRSWEKLAIVSDEDWIRRGVKGFGWMISGRVKLFSVAELEQAKEWVAD